MRLVFIFDRGQQGRYRLIGIQPQVALLRLEVALAIELAGADGGHIGFVEFGFALAIDDPRRAQQVGIGIVVGQVAEAVVELELQLAATAPHAAPAVKQNADDDDDTNDDQPIAQLHETPKPLNDENVMKIRASCPCGTRTTVCFYR